ncbi:acyl-CoA-binding domain-containing protein 6-like [Tubulanus polymorphus]|uniref:acyl-CoA-binding domain-containing protein 6-like n=1 Tax=Tubulanus polymorphus TaxID=672921 RepID=UPI003DA5ECB6
MAASSDCRSRIEFQFRKASAHLSTIADTLESEELLYFYSRFKQANEGPCDQPKPGLFDFQGKQKWEAWKKLGTKTREEAMVEYIEQLSKIDRDWEMKSSGDCKVGFGIGVSTLYREEAEVAPENKTIFDWCIEGNVENVERNLKAETINIKGDDGLGLIHWACDRGCIDMVRLLLKCNADINLQDSDGQTGLHYACSCDHSDVTELLLSEGADITIKDAEGLTAMDTTDNEKIKALFDIQR